MRAATTALLMLVIGCDVRPLPLEQLFPDGGTAAGSGVVWVGGPNLLAVFDGGTWQTRALNPAEDVRDIWGPSPDTIYIATSQRLLLAGPDGGLTTELATRWSGVRGEGSQVAIFNDLNQICLRTDGGPWVDVTASISFIDDVFLPGNGDVWAITGTSGLLRRIP